MTCFRRPAGTLTTGGWTSFDTETGVFTGGLLVWTGTAWGSFNWNHVSDHEALELVVAAELGYEKCQFMLEN